MFFTCLLQDMAQGHDYDFFVLCYEDCNDEEKAKVIVEFLEGRTNNDGQQYKGFFMKRDAEFGKSIVQNMTSAIENSRKVFVLISEEAMNNNWWKHSAHTLLMHRLNSEDLHDTIIPIYLPGMDMKNSPSELQIYEGVYYENDGDDFLRKILQCLS